MAVFPVLFAGLGIVGGLVARDFDDLPVMHQSLLRPLVFFGAVFYSLKVLPSIWQRVFLLNPMVDMVDSVRYGVLGYTDLLPLASLGVLVALTAAVLAVDVSLFRTWFGLAE